MRNISLNKEQIILNAGKKYYVMDALYLDDIKNFPEDLDKNDLANEIKKKVFLYTKTPFAIYETNKGNFRIDMIHKVNYKEIEHFDDSYFSTDTGLLILFNECILIDLLKLYEYDKLVDSITSPINEEYWDYLSSHFTTNDVALMLAPGINSGVDFSGSGTYQIN